MAVLSVVVMMSRVYMVLNFSNILKKCAQPRVSKLSIYNINSLATKL
jgi:hypothetical protein